MTRKGARQTFFVCIGMDFAKGDFVSKIIPSDSPKNASTLFHEQTNLEAKEVLGPFFKKRAQVIENTRVLKFTNQSRKAVYNDWLVTAFILQEPENHAYLVFTKRVDDKKLPTPKGTITVPISELRFV